MDEILFISFQKNNPLIRNEKIESFPTLNLFITGHWEATRIVVTDPDDRQLLLMRDAIDLLNILYENGSVLEAIFYLKTG